MRDIEVSTRKMKNSQSTRSRESMCSARRDRHYDRKVAQAPTTMIFLTIQHEKEQKKNV